MSGQSEFFFFLNIKCKKNSRFVRNTAFPTHLGGDVVRRAAESARGVAPEHPLPAHPEVCDLDVALAVQQHVIQLQIPGKRQRERERTRRMTGGMNHSDGRRIYNSH